MDVGLMVGAAIGGVCSWALTRFLSQKERLTEPLQDETCSGYQDANDYAGMKNDCRGLRNVTCGDGRCTYHCRKMCKCEASNEPEYVGRPR